MVPPVVAFATFQIKTIVPVKPWDRPDPGFNSGLVSVLIHTRRLFVVVFPSEPIVLPEHLFFVLFLF